MTPGATFDTVRVTTFAAIVVGLALAVLAGCNDVRDFRGTWQGDRVGDNPALRVGAGERATLVIDEIDTHGLVARLAIPALVTETTFSSVPGAEADALASMTFPGSPLRVYLAFVAIPDGGGDAFVLVALYDDDRVEVRLLRSGTRPLYGIFALRQP
jgi:hypothetical protein